MEFLISTLFRIEKEELLASFSICLGKCVRQFQQTFKRFHAGRPVRHICINTKQVAFLAADNAYVAVMMGNVVFDKMKKPGYSPTLRSRKRLCLPFLYLWPCQHWPESHKPIMPGWQHERDFLRSNRETAVLWKHPACYEKYDWINGIGRKLACIWADSPGGITDGNCTAACTLLRGIQKRCFSE